MNRAARRQRKLEAVPKLANAVRMLFLTADHSSDVALVTSLTEALLEAGFYLQDRNRKIKSGKTSSVARTVATPEKIEEARRLRRDGLTYIQIGKIIGVSQSRVHQLVGEEKRVKKPYARRDSQKYTEIELLDIYRKGRMYALRKQLPAQIADEFSAYLIERALEIRILPFNIELQRFMVGPGLRHRMEAVGIEADILDEDYQYKLYANDSLRDSARG